MQAARGRSNRKAKTFFIYMKHLSIGAIWQLPFFCQATHESMLHFGSFWAVLE
jgi:hypothetical protein